jgi:hypothetical protein
MFMRHCMIIYIGLYEICINCKCARAMSPLSGCIYIAIFTASSTKKQRIACLCHRRCKCSTSTLGGVWLVLDTALSQLGCVFESLRVIVTGIFQES